MSGTRTREERLEAEVRRLRASMEEADGELRYGCRQCFGASTALQAALAVPRCAACEADRGGPAVADIGHDEEAHVAAEGHEAVVARRLIAAAERDGKDRWIEFAGLVGGAVGCLHGMLPGDNGHIVAAVRRAAAERDEARAAVAGLLEAFDVAVGDESPLPDAAKGVVRGAFVGQVGRARALVEGPAGPR